MGEDEEPPVPLVTHVNNILHSIFSNDEVYINNQQNYISDALYLHKSYISDHIKAAICENKEEGSFSLRAVQLRKDSC